MLTPVNGFPAFPVILIGPHARPEFGVVGGDHPSLPACRHDLVLAEGPGAGIAEAADHAGVYRGAMRLRAILNDRSEEHTSELQSLMRISYAVFCLKKKKLITII